MKVYAVLVEVAYEGSTLVGMFSSREEAETFGRAQDCYVQKWRGYHVFVVECELGKPVDTFEAGVEL